MSYENKPDSSPAKQSTEKNSGFLRSELDSMELYRGLVESLSEVVYRAEPDTFEITYVNTAVETVFGIKRENWISSGAGFFERAVHPDDWERVFAQLEKSRKEVKGTTLEYRIVRADEAVRWVEDRIDYEVDASGKVTAITGILYDITDRKKEEDENRERRDMIAKIADTVLDALIMIDDTATVRYWNKAAERIFGYTEAEAVGSPLPALIVPERYLVKLTSGFGRFVETGAGKLIDRTVEMTGRRKDGSEFPVEHSIAALNRKGRWHAVGIIRDISERKSVEDRLAERIDELERFRDATVGREFKLHELKLEIEKLTKRIKELGG